MITTIRITNTEEAKTAIKMIEAYLLSTGEKIEEPTVEKKPVIKVSATGTVEQAEEKPTAEEPKKAKRTSTKKKVEEPKAEEEEAVEEITVGMLTQLAKDAVKRTGDRDAVKEVVTKYGAKISAVNNSDYEALAEDLKAL